MTSERSTDSKNRLPTSATGEILRSRPLQVPTRIQSYYPTVDITNTVHSDLRNGTSNVGFDDEHRKQASRPTTVALRRREHPGRRRTQDTGGSFDVFSFGLIPIDSPDGVATTLPSDQEALFGSAVESPTSNVSSTDESLPSPRLGPNSVASASTYEGGANSTDERAMATSASVTRLSSRTFDSLRPQFDQQHSDGTRMSQAIVHFSPVKPSSNGASFQIQTVETNDEMCERRSSEGVLIDQEEDHRTTTAVFGQTCALSAAVTACSMVGEHACDPLLPDTKIMRRRVTFSDRITTPSRDIDGASKDEDFGRLSDDDDEGVYDETFRYSTFKFIGDATQSTSDQSTSSGTHPAAAITDLVDTTTSNSSGDEDHNNNNVGLIVSKGIDERTTYRGGLSHVTGSIVRSMSLPSTANREAKFTLSTDRKTIQRQRTMMTYVASDMNYAVERILTLTRNDSTTSFGFHVSGSRPVTVSTVEPGNALQPCAGVQVQDQTLAFHWKYNDGSIADRTGVLVGDRIIAVNEIIVVTDSQDKVRQLISNDECRVQLGVAAGTLSRDTAVHAGYLHRYEGPVPPLRTWRRRWVQIKHDGFLYICKNEKITDPLGAIGLLNCIIGRELNFNGRHHVLKLVKYGKKIQTNYFQCESSDDVTLWASAVNSISTRATAIGADSWLDVSSHNVGLSALSIRDPDCHGFLEKVGNHRRTWHRRYCVLKNACLYYYRDPSSTTAKGVAHLHGYLVQDDNETRRFGFELVPPIISMRHFQFTASNETDMKRWKTAMMLSIGKWTAI